jgi:hypothetical protein
LKHRAVLHIGEWDVVELARVLCFVHDKIMHYNMSIVNYLRIHGMVRGVDRSQRVSSVTSRALFDRAIQGRRPDSKSLNAHSERCHFFTSAAF